ncbi:hypothetical protein [Desulfovibrio sp. ZJ200]|uniref:hypothetical protein n=1 Tax=Desulfovibrio sp. ZJ200 TaxID=2709792 RepID=UPI0013EB3C29|nr:hypothetical protein [Desulfovibrio sp. ZJ200]
MSEKVSLDLSRYDSAFLLAYQLVADHIHSGNATTADIPNCLAELTEIIRKFGGKPDSRGEQEPRT